MILFQFLFLSMFVISIQERCFFLKLLVLYPSTLLKMFVSSNSILVEHLCYHLFELYHLKISICSYWYLFNLQRGHFNQVTRQSTKWEKDLCQLHIDKNPIIINQSSNPVNKWFNEMSRQFSENDIHMATKHTVKYSASLAIKGMQIRATSRFHLTPVRMAIIKKNTICW